MIGCLCIHGFTGAPYEIEPLASYLMKTTDLDIKMITLPGHNEGESLKGITYRDWINYAEFELVRMLNTYPKVYIIGFSMGGIISSYLSAKYSVEKLVLLSAAADYMNPKQLCFDIKEMINDAFKGNLNNNSLFQRYKEKISRTPMRATIEFRRLVKELKPSISQVSTPTLIIQGECDGIVPVKSAYYIYNNIGTVNKEIHLLPNSKHHLCHGEDQDKLFQIVSEFLMH